MIERLPQRPDRQRRDWLSIDHDITKAVKNAFGANGTQGDVERSGQDNLLGSILSVQGQQTKQTKSCGRLTRRDTFDEPSSS
jgi:hypothetical protein